MTTHTALSSLIACALLLAACGGTASETTPSAVEAGSYEGPITEVTLSDRTLTVAAETDTLRAFFADSARVVNDSLEVGFGSLVAGDRVRVTVQPSANQLDATHIEVLQSVNDPLDP